MIFTLSSPQSDELLPFANQKGTETRVTNQSAIIRKEATRLALARGEPVIVRGAGEILAYVTPRTDDPLPYVVWNFTIPLKKSRTPLGFKGEKAEEKVNA